MLVTTKTENERRLIDQLISAGRLDMTSADRALRAQSETGRRLSSILINLGLCIEQDVVDAIADITGIDRIEAGAFPDGPLPGIALEAAFLKTASLVPIAEDASGLTVAMSDVLDDEPARALAFMLSLIHI